MASSNIKLFDENKGNMLSDSEFSISTQRLNGLQTGVASSQLQNKAMYQASLVAYAIAQVMMQNGKNANDTDAVSAFVANLSGTMLQKVYDIATTAEAQAGVATGKWMSPALVKTAIDTLAAKAQNILSDETKVLLGLGTNSVPDNAFTSLKNLIDGNYSELSSLANSKAKIATGSYVGTGTYYGDGNTNALTYITVGFTPKLLIVTERYGRTLVAIGQNIGFCTAGTYVKPFANNNDTPNITTWGPTITLQGSYNTRADGQFNAKNTTYYWVAIV